MRTFATAILAFTAFSAAPLSIGAQFPVSLGGFQWRTDLETARKAAVAEGKPLLVVFR